MDGSSSGGSSIGGSVGAGRDVTGRDSININIDKDEHEPRLSDSERLRRIERALLGDPYRPLDVGLLRAFQELRDTISSLVARQGALEMRQATIETRQLEMSEDARKRQTRTDWRLLLVSGGGVVSSLLIILYMIFFGG